MKQYRNPPGNTPPQSEKSTFRKNAGSSVHPESNIRSKDPENILNPGKPKDLSYDDSGEYFRIKKFCRFHLTHPKKAILKLNQMKNISAESDNNKIKEFRF